MSARLFALLADYEGQPCPQAVYSTIETTLRMIGQDHPRAAIIKPRLALKNPDGITIATMDEWENNWTNTQT